MKGANLGTRDPGVRHTFKPGRLGAVAPVAAVLVLAIGVGAAMGVTSGGQQGPKGDTGAPGPPGTPGSQITLTGSESQEALVCGDGTCRQIGSGVAECPSGAVPVSGGFFEDSSLSALVDAVLFTSPVIESDGTLGWGVVIADVDNLNDGGFFATANCASESSASAMAQARRAAMPLSRFKAIAARSLHARSG